MGNVSKVIGLIGTVLSIGATICGHVSQKAEIKKAAEEAVKEILKEK